MLLTEKTNTTVTFGKSKQRSVSFVGRFISIFILLLSLRIHEQQQLVLSGDLSRPVLLADLTAVPWKRFMLTKSKKYEDQIFFLTLFWLTVPGLCFCEKVTKWVSLLWKMVQGLTPTQPCPVHPLPEAADLAWGGSAQQRLRIMNRALFSLSHKQHWKRFTLFSWTLSSSRSRDPFVGQHLFTLSQQICS